MMMAAGSDDDLAEATQGSSSSNGAASSSSGFRVLCKGMASNQAAVVAAAVLGPQGDVVFTLHKPVVGFVCVRDGKVLLEATALLEGLHAAVGLGITPSPPSKSSPITGSCTTLCFEFVVQKGRSLQV
ncbi:unnamed protein product [Urochloa humidicola]